MNVAKRRTGWTGGRRRGVFGSAAAIGLMAAALALAGRVSPDEAPAAGEPGGCAPCPPARACFGGDRQPGGPRLCGTPRADPGLAGGAAGERICGLAGDDAIDGGAGDDRLAGDPGADLVAGGAGDDLVRGGDGDDRLLGGPGADTLYGDRGDDRLYGQAGDDTYVYRPGDGDDVIRDRRGANRLVLAQIPEQRVAFERRGDDLVVRVDDFFDPGSVRIAGYYAGGAMPVVFEMRPDFVVVLADDLGWGDLEPYGQAVIRTPRLARMAAEGAVFRQFYSAAPVCPPAREGLLTGRHTGHLQVRTEGVVAADSAAAPRYLPRLLGAAGYVSGMFGKWGLGDYRLNPDGSATAAGGPPHRVGFDEFLGPLTHRDAHTYTLPPYPLRPADPYIHPRLWTIRNGGTREADGQVPYTQALYLARTLDFIRRHRGEPFFLYLPWTLPHAELYLPPDDRSWAGYLDAAGHSVFPETPWNGASLYRRPNPRPRATYAAMVSRFDDDVGRVLDMLDAVGLGEHTVVVVTSDNGPHSAGGIGGPGYFGSTGGLSGEKFSLREGGIRVPAIVRWTGTVPAGLEVDEPFALWDLLPTFLELAGRPPYPAADGVSMAPLLCGLPGQRPHDAAAPLYWETFTNSHGQAVRVGRYKALRRGLSGPGDPVALYDLEADPAERTDLAGRPELCPLLRDLVRLLNGSRTDPGGEYSFPRLREPVCPAAGQ